jgi:hypothetical protein
MRSPSNVNHFFFFAGEKISVRCSGSVKGAVLYAAKRTLDGFCATSYRSIAGKNESPLQLCLSLSSCIASQPSIRTLRGPIWPVHLVIPASAATLTTVYRNKHLFSVNRGEPAVILVQNTVVALPVAEIDRYNSVHIEPPVRSCAIGESLPGLLCPASHAILTRTHNRPKEGASEAKDGADFIARCGALL